MTNDAEVSHRSALWLSMALTVLGSCGACNGMSNFSNTPIPSQSAEVTDDTPGAVEMSAFAITLAEAVIDAPNRRPLALANFVCSMMLVAGGFMLGIRRANARWFITNALVANIAWIVSDASIAVMQLEGWRSVLVRRLVPWIRAVADPALHMTPRLARESAEGYVTTLTLAVVFGGFVKAAIHAFVLVRARSPLIERFIEDGNED